MFSDKFEFLEITKSTYVITDRDIEKTMDMSAERRIGVSQHIYLVVGEKAAVIDPGTFQSPRHKIFEFAKSVNLKPSDIVYILNTHTHDDHVQGNAYVKAISGAKIAAHPLIIEKTQHMHTKTEQMWKEITVDIPLKEGDKIDLGNNLSLTALETPGHSPDHIVFYNDNEKTLFVGDLLQGREEYMHAGWLGLISNVEEYEKSLQRIGHMNINIILDPHHKPLFGCDISQCIENCLKRSQKIKETVYKVLMETKKKLTLENLHDEVIRKMYARMLPYNVNAEGTPTTPLNLQTICAYVDNLVREHSNIHKKLIK